MNGAAPVIVVTGGNRGIGFEICRQLAGRGAQVVLTARKAEAGREAVEKLAAQKLTARFHPLDVTSSDGLGVLRDFLDRTFGHLDVLINNAGIISDDEASGLEPGAVSGDAVVISARGPNWMKLVAANHMIRSWKTQCYWT